MLTEVLDLALKCFTSSPSYSRALLISSAALSMRAFRMAARGMETCSEMDEKGGLSLSAAEQDIGHNSRQRETIESTTTCVQLTQNMHHQTYITYIFFIDSQYAVSKPMNYLCTVFSFCFLRFSLSSFYSVIFIYAHCRNPFIHVSASNY